MGTAKGEARLSVALRLGFRAAKRSANVNVRQPPELPRFGLLPPFVSLITSFILRPGLQSVRCLLYIGNIIPLTNGEIHETHQTVRPVPDRHVVRISGGARVRARRSRNFQNEVRRLPWTRRPRQEGSSAEGHRPHRGPDHGPAHQGQRCQESAAQEIPDAFRGRCQVRRRLRQNPEIDSLYHRSLRQPSSRSLEGCRFLQQRQRNGNASWHGSDRPANPVNALQNLPSVDFYLLVFIPL